MDPSSLPQYCFDPESLESNLQGTLTSRQRNRLLIRILLLALFIPLVTLALALKTGGIFLRPALWNNSTYLPIIILTVSVLGITILIVLYRMMLTIMDIVSGNVKEVSGQIRKPPFRLGAPYAFQIGTVNLQAPRAIRKSVSHYLSYQLFYSPHSNYVINAKTIPPTSK